MLFCYVLYDIYFILLQMYHIVLNNFYMEICADVNISLLYYVSIFYRKEKKLLWKILFSFRLCSKILYYMISIRIFKGYYDKRSYH